MAGDPKEGEKKPPEADDSTIPSSLRRPRRVARGTRYRGRSTGTQWLYIALAILFLLAFFVFRDTCSKKIGKAYEQSTGKVDAGPGRIPADGGQRK